MISDLEQTLLALMVFFIMIGMGAALTIRDFYRALRRPYGLCIGLVSQFGFMPFAGFVLGSSLDVPAEVAIGILILACVPGGPVSNLFTYFSRGDLALSVSMTVASMFCGALLTPLVLALYASAMNLSIPLHNIALTLALVLVPIALGMTLHTLNPRLAALVERLGATLGVAFIIAAALSWILRNHAFLADAAPALLFASIIMGVVGFAFGHTFARLARLPRPMGRAVTLETGIQNAPLAIAVVALNFAPEDQPEILSVIALYSLFIVMSASLVAITFRHIDSLHKA